MTAHPGELNLDLNLDDIDAFIASVTVPPPPARTPPLTNGKSPDDLDLPPPPEGLLADPDKTPTAEGSFPPPPDVVAHTHPDRLNQMQRDHSQMVPDGQAQGNNKEWNLNGVAIPDNISLEEEYAALVIPPPPDSCNTEALQQIAIVPPVDVKTPSPPDTSHVTMREAKSNLAAAERESVEVKRKSLLELQESGPSVAALTKTLQEQTAPAQKSADPNRFVRKISSTSNVEKPVKTKQPLAKKMSADAIVRPKGQPPPPPERLNSYPGARPGSQSISLPSSPPDDTNEPFIPGLAGQTHPNMEHVLAEANLKPSLRMWRPTQSADNSPVHKGKNLAQTLTGVTGTLTRNKKGMFAPAPPPRRSSMPVSQSLPTTPSHGKSNSLDATPITENTSQSKYKPLTNINYVNVFEAQSVLANEIKNRNATNVTGSKSASLPNSAHSTPSRVIQVDSKVNINMDRIKAELQRKLSGSLVLGGTAVSSKGKVFFPSH